MTESVLFFNFIALFVFLSAYVFVEAEQRVDSSFFFKSALKADPVRGVLLKASALEPKYQGLLTPSPVTTNKHRGMYKGL